MEPWERTGFILKVSESVQIITLFCYVPQASGQINALFWEDIDPAKSLEDGNPAKLVSISTMQILCRWFPYIPHCHFSSLKSPPGRFLGSAVFVWDFPFDCWYQEAAWNEREWGKVGRENETLLLDQQKLEKNGKKPKLAETGSDRPEKALCALKHGCFYPSISVDLIKDIVSYYKHWLTSLDNRVHSNFAIVMEQRHRSDEWPEDKFESNSALRNTKNKTKEPLQTCGPDLERLFRLTLIWSSAFKKWTQTSLWVFQCCEKQSHYH